MTAYPVCHGPMHDATEHTLADVVGAMSRLVATPILGWPFNDANVARIQAGETTPDWRFLLAEFDAINGARSTRKKKARI